MSDLWDEDEPGVLKKYEKDMIAQMFKLAEESEVFTKIVAHEWDGEMSSINSSESLVRNAMITRYNVYNTEELGQKEWEENLLTNDFYAAAF